MMLKASRLGGAVTCPYRLLACSAVAHVRADLGSHPTLLLDFTFIALAGAELTRAGGRVTRPATDKCMVPRTWWLAK